MHHHSHHTHHGHHLHMPGPKKPQMIAGLVLVVIWKLFIAGSISCFLLAAHRLAYGVLLSGRAKALHVIEDSITPEEKELLVERIKADALCCRWM